MELFVRINYGREQIFLKSSILDVWRGSEYTSENLFFLKSSYYIYYILTYRQDRLLGSTL